MTARVIILGAGKPVEGEVPSGLRQTDRRQKVLDWILHAFRQLDAEVCYVGGYRVADIASRYSGLKFIHNEDWETTGALASFYKAPLSADRDHYVCYSDIVFRDDLVAKLRAVESSRAAAAVDREFLLHRGDDSHRGASAKEQIRLAGQQIKGAVNGSGANTAVAEFVGLVRFPRAVMPKVMELAPLAAGARRRAHLSALIDELCRADVPVEAIDAEGHWSDLDSDMALSRFVLGTKAETLDRLRDRVASAEIAPQVRFSVDQWRNDGKQVLRDIEKAFPPGRLAVRSSAAVEDGFASAYAGRFRSCLDVVNDIPNVTAAIEQVIESYQDSSRDQIFVQPMVTNVSMSGVVFTRMMGTGAPYYTVNFASGPDTTSVTSGAAQEAQTLVIHRTSGKFPAACPKAIRKLIEVVREIEELVDYDRLDIEFAVDQSDRIHILQVRPLAASHEWHQDSELRVAVSAAASDFNSLQSPQGNAVGRSNVWGSMPDWNPAEIIGARPKGLAASLYALLVTDDIWARQRAEFGYRDLRGTPLMRMFASQPYIDVRASLNSFTPANVPEATVARLVDGYLAKLRARPELHDKIEFDIVPTCLAFDWDRWRDELSREPGLNVKELEALRGGLLQITKNAFTRYQGDSSAAAELSRRFSKLKTSSSSLTRAKQALADCREFGTLPFAHLAREAFIAVTLLRSAVARGAVASERLESFLASIHTVSQRLSEDAAQVRAGVLTLADLTHRYGHLRPGTYDILSPCYADDAEYYLSPLVEQADMASRPVFRWDSKEAQTLVRLSREADLDVGIEGLDRFFRTAIEGRESQKFLFSRNLSLALNDIAAFGEACGLSRSDLAELHYSDLAGLVDEHPKSAACAQLQELAESRRAKRTLEQAVELPPLLRSADEFWGFFYPLTEPNYITSGHVTASGISLDQQPRSRQDLSLSGKIVLIPQADPGYDWLFGHGIAGLVTQFGGANSHMAIRAAEHRLPSAIGVGHDRYRGLKGAKLIDLNCATRQLAAVN